MIQGCGCPICQANEVFDPTEDLPESREFEFTDMRLERLIEEEEAGL